MKLDRVRAKRVAEGEDAGAWTRALEDASWIAEAKVLKDEPGSSWVRRARVNGREVVVKCRLLNSVSRRVKAAVRMGHGAKQWRGSAKLMRAGIATARPLVMARAAVDGARCELLVLEWVAGPTVLEVLAEIAAGRGPGVREQHAMAEAVGRSVAELSKAHLWNRDHKPSNLVMVRTGAASRAAIIDCVGIKPDATPGVDDDLLLAEMLFSLTVEPIGCGCRPRRGLCMRCVWACLEGLGWRSDDRRERHAVIGGLFERVSNMLDAHGDPRPKVDPLASRPGSVGTRSGEVARGG